MIRTVNVNYTRAFVYVEDRAVAVMERSPWTGEWCYGLRIGSDKNGRTMFSPAFKPTRFKTAKAAAKVAVTAFNA